MRRAALGFLLIAGCGGTNHPELHLDVTVSSDFLYVHAIEVDRPDATSQAPFAHPGECDETSDAWFCDGPCPATWLGELRIEAGDTVLTGVYDWPWGGGISLDEPLSGAVLIVEDLDGAEIEIPIPDTEIPAPTIDDISIEGDEVVVSWSGDADSAVIEVGGGFGGPRCHTTAGSVRLPWGGSAGGEAYVHAYAAPTLVETSWGDAEVWLGDLATAPLPTAARRP